MISKVFITGKSFGETCAYLCKDMRRAEVLAVEGVRGYDYRCMAADFEVQHRLMPEKEKPVFHGVLSFPAGEKPADERMVELARKYLEEIGMKNTQYAVVKHTDTAHLHVHVIANRVNNEGKVTGQGLIIERGIRAAEKLTREYGLSAERGKQLDRTNMEALHKPDAKKYRLYQAIQESLPGCGRLEDLEKKLLEKGISTRYKYDAVNHERVGISFRIEGQSFKGSGVDKAFSFSGLQRTVDLQMKERLRLETEERLRKELELERERALKQETGEAEELKNELKPGLREEPEEEERQEIRIRRGRHL